MAKEELVLEVKSNIESVTKETKEYKKSLEQVNEEINLQTKYIIAQEKELIKLKAQQDAIPKGGWVAGMDKLNDKIRETTAELNDEKNGLKSLKQEQKEATQQIKKSTVAKKSNNKVSKESIANFQVMGVSLNGVKKGFLQVIPTAKLMFGTIRAGMISTGIGALVVGVMALFQSFKRSEEGQEKFQRIMAAIGAVTSIVLDAFSDLGGIIIDTFRDPLPSMEKFGKGLLKFLRDPTGATRDMFIKATLAYQDFTEQTAEEIAALDVVTKMRQKAHHIDRKLKVERAEANREINDIRLQAEDREKNSARERIDLLRKAQKIEQDITDKEIESKNLLIDAQVLHMAQGHNTIEQKDKLAQLQADAINLDTKRLRGQRLLQTQITTALNEEKTAREKANIEMTKMVSINQALSDGLIFADNEAFENWLSNWESKKNKAKELADFEEELQMKAFYALGSHIDASMDVLEGSYSKEKRLAEANGQSTEAIDAKYEAKRKKLAQQQKVFKIAEALITTYQMASLAYKDGLEAGGPYGLILGPIAAGVAAAVGLANVRSIMGQDVGGGGGGGGGGGVVAAPPSPQMMSGAFELTGGQEVEPARAYVVSDDITNNQNKLAIIRRRATI